MPTQASRRKTAGTDATRVRPGRSATAILERVRVILEETCVNDGQGSNLEERARRKAYRAGINRALAEIRQSRETR